MNFRTTIILLILLIGAGVFLVVVNISPEVEKPKTDPADAERGRRLFDVKLADIKKLNVLPGEGAPPNSEPLELTKVDGEWKITRPIDWPADSSEAGGFVSAVADLRSSATIEVTDQNRAGTGLATPRFTVELTDTAGKVHKLHVGARSELGRLYVQVDDEKQTASVVTDGTLSEKLARGINPLVASLRDKKLITVSTFDVKQIQIDRGNEKLALAKESNAWKLTEPQALAADTAEVSDILSTITNLRADSFATETTAGGGGARFEQPRAVITLSTDPPASATTAPATLPATAPASRTVTVTIGQPTDLTGDKSWVKVSDPPSVAIVSLGGPSFEKIEKASVLSLRDRRVFDVDPEDASQITLTTETASATQPSEKQSITLERRKENLELGPQPPKPAEGEAATPATQPEPATQRAAEPATQRAAEPATQPAAATTQPAASPATQPGAVLPNGGTTRVRGGVAWVNPLGRASQPREDHRQGYLAMPRGNASLLNRLAAMFIPATLLQAQGAPTTEPAAKSDEPAAPATEPAGPATKLAAPELAAPATEPAAPPATAPATAPATQPVATQPAVTQPAAETLPAVPEAPPQPPTQWVVASAGAADANDPAINNLLFALHPLRAAKFLDAMPAADPGTQPATQPATSVYVLTVTAVAAGGKTETHELRITDRGGSSVPIGQYQDLIFEIDRAFVTKLKADFDDPNAGLPQDPDAPRGPPPGMMPQGLPPGFQLPPQ